MSGLEENENELMKVIKGYKERENSKSKGSSKRSKLGASKNMGGIGEA